MSQIKIRVPGGALLFTDDAPGRRRLFSWLFGSPLPQSRKIEQHVEPSAEYDALCRRQRREMKAGRARAGANRAECYYAQRAERRAQGGSSNL